MVDKLASVRQVQSALGPSHRGPVVISFVNAPYLQLLDIWLRQSTRYLPGKPIIFCMDLQAFEYCRKRDDVIAISVSQDERSDATDGRARNQFWVARMEIFQGLIGAKIDFIHSDLDAFWLAHPENLFDVGSADLAFSREYGIPKVSVDRWGFALCCGLFLARATEATAKFFEKWADETSRMQHDQIALGFLLVRLGAEWKEDGGTRARVTVGDDTVEILAFKDSEICREHPIGVPATTKVAHSYFERPFFVSFLDLFDLALTKNGDLRTDPSDPSFVADKRHRLKDREAVVLGVLNWACQIKPEHAPFQNHIGALLTKAGAYDEAEKALSFACRAEPDRFSYRNDLAKLYMAKGDTGSAIRELKRAAASPGATSGVFKNLAKYSLSRGRPFTAAGAVLGGVNAIGLKTIFGRLALRVQRRV